MSNEEKVQKMIYDLSRDGRLEQERKYIQHGTTTVFEHSCNVATVSLFFAEFLHLSVDQRSLIRGALLHDYFLYDWHEKSDDHRWHGFHHASRALENAKADYELDAVEEDIIGKHMFPLNLRPPKYKESWLVCLADKYCAVRETLF